MTDDGGDEAYQLHLVSAVGTLCGAPQYLLARGDLALLVPNVRGSTGYGRECAQADDVELRMDSVRDLNAATDWLAGVSGARFGVCLRP